MICNCDIGTNLQKDRSYSKLEIGCVRSEYRYRFDFYHDDAEAVAANDPTCSNSKGIVMVRGFIEEFRAWHERPGC